MVGGVKIKIWVYFIFYEFMLGISIYLIIKGRVYKILLVIFVLWGFEILGFIVFGYLLNFFDKFVFLMYENKKNMFFFWYENSFC